MRTLIRILLLTGFVACMAIAASAAAILLFVHGPAFFALAGSLALAAVFFMFLGIGDGGTSATTTRRRTIGPP